ncbi:hypothetical protein OIO90_004154 [Microbotryomycetes sp. JL221]|nr:hypothetical protein OIO90_004154 [Microbotryomycetes sp. JL221]
MAHRSVVKVVPGKQERFRSAIHAYPEVIATADKMIKGAALLNIPTIVTEQNPKALGSTVSELDLTTLSKQCQPDWSPLSKTKFSMVLPQVVDSLNQWGTKSVVLFGIESHVCVLQTALDLLERDIDVHVLADGVSSCNHGEVPIALDRLRQAGAQVTTSESVLFQLMVDASHPAFKQVSGLIKQTKQPTTDALDRLVVGKL